MSRISVTFSLCLQNLKKYELEFKKNYHLYELKFSKAFNDV